MVEPMVRIFVSARGVDKVQVVGAYAEDSAALDLYRAIADVLPMIDNRVRTRLRLLEGPVVAGRRDA